MMWQAGGSSSCDSWFICAASVCRRKEERLRRKEEERLRKEAEVRAWTSQVSQENKGIKDKNRYTSSLQSDA